MRILITGISGFVGSNLAPYLSEQHTVYGLDIVAPEMPGVEQVFSWEDCFSDRLPQVDAIVHLAGIAHATGRPRDAAAYFKVNRDLTVRIFDYFRTHAVAKFIFFSTVKAVAEVVPDVLTEEAEPAPEGPYGESKLAAERYILNCLREDPAEFAGRGVYIFRPCMIHGPGNKGNLNLVYRVVSRGIPWPLGAFDNRRTFTSVENICFAVSGVLTGNVASGIYNMADDEALSTNEVIEVIGNVLGRRIPVWNVPRRLVSGAARVGGWLHLPLNPERLRKLTESYIASNAKIKAALGVAKMPVRARDGLVHTLECFKKGKGGTECRQS